MSSPHRNDRVTRACCAVPGWRLWGPLLASVSLLLAGCDAPPAEQEPVVIEPRVSDSVAGDSAPPLGAASTYDPALGDLLLVPVFDDQGRSDRVAVLSPLHRTNEPVDDTLGLRERVGDGRVVLLSRAGLVAERVVQLELQPESAGVAPEPNVCAVWPHGRLVVPSGTADSTLPLAAGGDPASGQHWLVAFPAGMVTPLSLDSIETLPSRDSAMLAASVTRLASALDEDSASAFRGLPFGVSRLYRTRGLEAGFALAQLVRRIPQEDRPLEERLLVLVTTDAPDARQWSIAWFERTSGREEEVIATEPLAVARARASGRVLVMLGRDDGTGTSLALLERIGDRWQIRWESPVSGC